VHAVQGIRRYPENNVTYIKGKPITGLKGGETYRVRMVTDGETFVRAKLVRDWARYHEGGYEVSSQGDTRFSPLYARLRDGRTIEEAYQLDVKGYRDQTDNWLTVKGKPPRDKSKDLYAEFRALWWQWCMENPELLEDLRRRTAGKVLTDRFAKTPINQARALADILDATDI
jgi:hypothetical protein